MIEGIIIFGLGFLFGKYTDKIIEFIKNLYNKYIAKNPIATAIHTVKKYLVTLVNSIMHP